MWYHHQNGMPTSTEPASTAEEKQSEMLSTVTSESKPVLEFWKELGFGRDAEGRQPEVEGFSEITFDAIFEQMFAEYNSQNSLRPSRIRGTDYWSSPAPFSSVREPRGWTIELYSIVSCLFLLVVMQKTASLVINWLLFLCFFVLHSLFLNQVKRQTWSGLWPWPWTVYPGIFLLPPNLSNVVAVNFFLPVEWHLATMPPLLCIWSLWSISYQPFNALVSSL